MSTRFLTAGGTDANGNIGTQLWVVTIADDGATTASELVDTYPGGPASTFVGPNGPVLPLFTAFGNGVLFEGYGLANETKGPGYGNIDPAGKQTGLELWYSDGTAAGTHLVLDAFKGTRYGVGNNGIVGGQPIFALPDGNVLFTAQTSASGTIKLFEIDKAGGVIPLTTGNPNNPSVIESVNTAALFNADVTTAGGPTTYLFTTNGTREGTRQLRDSAGHGFVGASAVAGLVTPEGQATQDVLFSDSSGNLWSTDGGNATELLAGGFSGGSQSIGNVSASKDLFLAFGAGEGGLWVTDGTAAKTVKLASLSAGPNPSTDSTGGFTNATGGAERFFEIHDSSKDVANPSLWVTDGTANGTKQVNGATGALGAYAVDGHVVFLTGFIDGGGNQQLGISSADGSGSEKVLRGKGVSFFHPGPTGKQVFVESTDTTSTLYITDGTASGTRGVTSGLSGFSYGLAAGGKLFFTAYDASNNSGVWVLGATGNASQLNIGTDTAATSLIVSGNELLFQATNTAGGVDTWVSDGTQGGTHLVAGGESLTLFKQAAPLPCFLAGTPILTARGEVPVEELRVGDLLLTLSGRGNPLKPISWVGRSRFDAARHPHPEHVIPVRIAAGALGDGLPRQDLLVSPGHSMFVDGALMQAARLVNGCTITRETQTTRGEYFHVEVEGHDILLSAGAPSETYLDTGNRSAFATDDKVVDLHPDFSPKHWTETCAPLLCDGPVLAAAKARFLRRATEAGFRADAENGLRVVADGVAIMPSRVDGGSYAFDIPGATTTARLVSRVWTPSEAVPDSTDLRQLGVFVCAMVADGEAVSLDDPRLTGGWHGVERHGDAARRWTSGDAALPARIRRLTVTLFSGGRYWTHQPPLPEPAAACAERRRSA